MIIELNDLDKSYGKNHVLKNIHLKLSEGKFYALLGRNGSGKSTLMKLLMRFEVPSSGTGKILGLPLGDFQEKLNKEIAYISEEVILGSHVTLKRFFKDYVEYYPKWDKNLFEEFLTIQKISISKSFDELSRGQKMQVALAAGLATHPRLLLLDEITSVLDAGARAFFLHYLGEFRNKGGTVLMATNIVSEVQHFAEHLILLEDGKIKTDLPLSEVSKNFMKVRKKFDTKNETLEKLDCVPVGLNSDNTLSYIIPKVFEQSLSGEGILPDKRNVTVEELFIYFTNGRRE